MILVGQSDIFLSVMINLPNTPLINNALRLAERAHAGQYRKDGMTAYVVHPIRVASKLAAKGETEEVIATGLLHDVLEDGDKAVISEDPYPKFSITVLAAVNALTKVEGETYSVYLERVKANPIARKVKVADILDNLGDDPSDYQIRKYAAALLTLV